MVCSEGSTRTEGCMGNCKGVYRVVYIGVYITLISTSLTYPKG